MVRWMVACLLLVAVIAVGAQDEGELPAPILGAELCDNVELLESVEALESTFTPLMNNFDLVNRDMENAPIAKVILELQVALWYEFQREKVLSCPQTAEMGLRMDAALVSFSIALGDLGGATSSRLLAVFGAAVGELNLLVEDLRTSIVGD